MDHAITVGQLRQNLTAMIRDVREGATYILTDRGRPVATIAPYRPAVWRSSDEVNDLLTRLGPDPAWAAEHEELRAEAGVHDPWEQRP